MNRIGNPEPTRLNRNDSVDGNTTAGRKPPSPEDVRMIARAQVQLLNLLADAVIEDLRKDGFQTTTNRTVANEIVRHRR